MATAGLILGIIGFLSSFLLVGMLFSAAGLAVSALSMSKGGGKKALFGMLFSIAGLLLPTVFIGSYIGSSPEQKAQIKETISTVLHIDPTRFSAVSENEAASAVSENILPLSEISVESEASEDGSEEIEELSEAATEEDAATALSDKLSNDYVAPSEESLEVAEDLAGKTGLGEIDESVETVTDDIADKLEEQLLTGPTGDDLEFDPFFYPYYDFINDNSKELYRQIYANAKIRNDHFKAVNKEISRKELSNAFEALFYDHPELFWLETAYSASYRKSGDCIKIELEFNSTADSFDNSKKEFDDAANEILDAASGLSSDFDKEKYVHDALAKRDSYSLAAPLNQSAYSSLVNGETVCAGYARAFQYLMQELKVPAYFCAGYAGEAHAWNIIKLGDDYYNLDVTWDDTEDDKVCNYDYFNKTDADFSKDHARRTLSVYLPACVGVEYAYDGSDEDGGEEEDLPGIEDYGFSEADLIKDISSYYDDTYRELVEKGKGSYHYTNIIEGDELYESLREAYNSKEADRTLLGKVLEELDASAVNISVQPVKLADGRYLLDHTISVY